MFLTFSIDDSTLGQIIGRQLHANFVARNDTDKVLSHAPGDVRHDLGPGLQLDPESRVGESLCNGAFDFEGIFFLAQNLRPISDTKN